MATIERVGRTEADRVLAAAELFDTPPTLEWTERFLSSPGHHLLLAVEDGNAVGFVTGIEMTHPDKGTELFLYELAVAEHARRRGIGKALVAALLALAEERGCTGLWVLTEPENEAARATYESAAGKPEDAALFAWSFED